MPVTLIVKSRDAGVKAQREAAANCVMSYFGLCLPDSRVLCFLDDDDPPNLKAKHGSANRGLYRPIKDNTWLADLPGYVTDCIHVDDGVSFLHARAVDDFVYLYGSTCASQVGLTMTLAHELQHAIQHSRIRKLWAVSTLVPGLTKQVIQALNLKWADIPIEREARIISKRAAECLFGEEAVRKYIDEKIAERISEDDVADWQFVRTLSPSSAVDLITGTQNLFQRLQGYRSELQKVLQDAKKDDSDFADVDLDTFFNNQQN